MKSKIYILLFALAITAFIPACSDEEVTPQSQESSNNGGNGQQDPI